MERKVIVTFLEICRLEKKLYADNALEKNLSNDEEGFIYVIQSFFKAILKKAFKQLKKKFQLYIDCLELENTYYNVRIGIFSNKWRVFLYT